MILAVLATILLVAALVTATRTVGQGDPHAAARRILDERVASGDLSPAARREQLAVLAEQTPVRSRRWLPWAMALAGVTLLVLPVGLAAGGVTDVGWANHWTAMGDHMGFGRGGTTTTSSADPDADTVTVEAGDLWFRPDTIEIPAGTTTNLTVHNTGEAFHDLTVPELDLRIDVEAGERTTVAITPEAPGTYDFHCSVPGHESGGMHGQLVVTAR